MLTKTVLWPYPDGTCSHFIVPFCWSRESPVPPDCPETRFASVRDALIALAARGRAAQHRIGTTATEVEIVPLGYSQTHDI